MSSSDLKSNFPTSHDTAGYVGFANLPNQVTFPLTFPPPRRNVSIQIFFFLHLNKKGSSEVCQERL